MFAFNRVALLTAVFAALAIARTATADTMLFGRVYDIPGNQLLVAVSTEIVGVTVDRATPVTINGDRANIADLEPDDLVSVTVSSGLDRTRLAVQITATRRPPGVGFLDLEAGALD